MAGTRSTAPLTRRRSIDAFLTVLGLALTVAAGVAAVWASGFQLSQPIAVAHIVPLWVIVGTLATVGVLYLQSNALRDGRAARLAALAGASVLAGALVLALGPTASSATPVGARLPWLEVSLAGVLLGSLCLLSVVLRRRRDTAAGEGPVPIGTVYGPLAVVLALGLVVGLSIAGQQLVGRYLDAVNEYHVNPVSGPGSSMRSALTGSVAWQVRAAPIDRSRSSANPYGVVVTEGSAVVELDAATGHERWRYQRSDVDAELRPQVWELDRGQELAVRWRSVLYVLDARTGARIDRWPSSYTSDERFDDTDPTLQEHPVSVDESVLTAVDDHGHRQWQYRQKCHLALGTATAVVTLVQASDYCGHADQTLGLDPGSGRQRWVLDHAVTVLALTDDTAVVTTAAHVGATTPTTAVSGIDLATGATRWTTPTTPDGHTCSTVKFQAQADSLMAICVVSSGGNLSDTWALRYDVSTGKLLDEADLGGQDVWSATVTADGRMVVLAQSRRTPSCLLTVIQPDSTRTVLPGVEPDETCLDTIQALGDEVLVTQFSPGYLRALR